MNKTQMLFAGTAMVVVVVIILIIGALGVIGTLVVFDPSYNLRLIAALGFVSAALVVLDRRLTLWPSLSASAVALGVLVLAILPDAWFGLRISPYKGLPLRVLMP